MNIYDLANDLGKALINSPEYLELKKAEEILSQNEKHREMVSQFMKQQMEIMGAELNDKQKEDFNTMTSNLMNIPEIAGYFQAQMLFGKMFEEIMNLVTGPLDLKE